MSAIVVLLVAVAWLGIGLSLALFLGRRGYDGFSWFVLGTMLGPFAVVLAADTLRHDERPAPRTLAASAAPPPDEPGGVDVLVGFDGSPESKAALTAAVELLGPRLGRVTLATVVPFDGGLEAERAAVQALDGQAERLAWLAPGLEVLHGQPGRALSERAAAGGYELVAAGTRGAGRAHLFGSAATELSRTSKVPVLLVGPGT